jgi:hypothetical protein
MVETTIEQLITRLRELQIETARTIELLEATRNEEIQRRQVEADRTPVAVATPVTPVASINTRTINLITVNYQVGDKVIITNATRGNHDKRATVTRTTGSRVYLRTNDNQVTWRHYKNLRLDPQR